MTIPQILAQLVPIRPISHTTLYKHIRALRIKPLGDCRQCPQLYPKNTADRVLARLGYKPIKAAKRNRREHTASR